jgi:hypothetical protein
MLRGGANMLNDWLEADQGCSVHDADRADFLYIISCHIHGCFDTVLDINLLLVLHLILIRGMPDGVCLADDGDI